GEVKGAALIGEHVVHDVLAGGEDVVDFLLQILLRLRQLEIARDARSHLLLGERVTLDGRRRVNALGDVHRSELFRGVRAKRGAGNVFDLGGTLPQDGPERPPQDPGGVELEADMFVSVLPCPVICHGVSGNNTNPCRAYPKLYQEVIDFSAKTVS